MQPRSVDSLLVRVAHPAELFQMHGVDGPGTGPVLVLVTHHAAVYDARSGAELAWFPLLDRRHYPNQVASCVYDGVLVVAADGEDLRQWELPSGRAIHTGFDPRGRTRAVTSYRDGERTVLVLVDDEGTVRRFDAALGTPIGKALRLPAERLSSRLARLVGKGDSAPVVVGAPQKIVMDPAADQPTALIVGRHGFWRVGLDAGAVTWLAVDAKFTTQHLDLDPRPGPSAVVISGYEGVAVVDAHDGRYTAGPLLIDDDLGGTCAAAVIDGRLRVFVAVGSGVSHWDGGDTTSTVLPPNETNENDDTDAVCVLEVDGRLALFASNAVDIYRYDASTGKPWPPD